LEEEEDEAPAVEALAVEDEVASAAVEEETAVDDLAETKAHQRRS
jgi:hypothetical protein